MKKTFITLEDSKALYGIAIIFMIYHHLFLDPARLNNNYISIWRQYEWMQIRIAWLCKLCVGIFAFISGYAMCIRLKKYQNCKSYIHRFRIAFQLSIKQLMNFYRKFWLVFIVFIPIGIVFYKRECSLSVLVNGLFFGGEGAYNSEWWYVKQYLILMLIFPVLDIVVSFVERMSKGITLLSMVLFIGGVAWIRLCFWNDTWISEIIIFIANAFVNAYTILFIIAFLCARYDVFENISRRIRIHVWFSALGLIGVLLIRWKIVTYPAQSMCDIFLVPFFMYFTTDLLHTSFIQKYVVGVLKFLGKYSTFMWLTHTFYAYYYFQELALMPKYSILIFIWVIILSLATAIIFERLDILCRQLGTKCKKCLLVNL